MDSRPAQDALALARAIVAAAADKKAEDIVLLDLRGISTITDYFVVCSGLSERQLRSIADNIQGKVSAEFGDPRHIEGLEGSGWVLMDYGDVVVHIFLPSLRSYYNLEALWSKAPTLLRMR
ncbi:MAG: ribosome silencing factor [Thermoflexales bacterium]